MQTITVQELKLQILQMEIRSRLPAGCIGYADFLTTVSAKNAENPNLIRLEQLVPGSLARWKKIMDIGR